MRTKRRDLLQDYEATEQNQNNKSNNKIKAIIVESWSVIRKKKGA